MLNAEGSTQTVLGAKLVIENGPVNFAINMQDTADGTLTYTRNSDNVITGATWTGFDITVTEGQPPSGPNPTTVNFANTLVMFVADDGIQLNTINEGQIGLAVGTAMYVPELTIDNYSTVDIVLPTESVNSPIDGDPQNYVILGGQDPLAAPGGIPNGAGFNINPVVTVNNAVVNFYDNNADNGGSPPGGEDNLVLGFTNATGTLTISDIGVTSVAIDTAALDFSTTINDFSTGSLEIGATNVTNLNAQSTSHLIMDLPATVPLEGAGGITVNGSLIGQNLLQGTSGLVVEDPAANGHNTLGATPAAVLEALSPLSNAGGWANDTLTGGDGFGSVTLSLVGGAPSATFTPGVSNLTVGQGFDGVTFGIPNLQISIVAGPGDTGDNFFGEGGNDVINIAAGEVGKVGSFVDVDSSSGSILVPVSTAYDNESTVWVGFYDVCNSGGPNALALNGGIVPNTGVGTVYDQAITDIVGGVETFVDGYGNTGKAADLATSTSSTPVVTINGFNFGTGNNVSTGTPGTSGYVAGNAGDTIVFGRADWAIGTLTGPTGVTAASGLVESDGSTNMPLGFATYAEVGTGGAIASTTGTTAGTAVKVVEDSIGGSYTSAAALQNALSNHSTSFFLASLPGGGVATGHEADILVAYQLAPTVANPGGAIAIADVTLTNTGSAASTDVAAMAPVVHDLVHINTTSGFVGVASLFSHNIYFMA